MVFQLVVLHKGGGTWRKPTGTGTRSWARLVGVVDSQRKSV